MGYRLFLDDERTPAQVYEHIARDPAYLEEWVVARSVAEAIRVVEERGWPDTVSFDHDLGRKPDGTEDKGIAFARYLVERDHDNWDMPDGFTFRVHSRNPVGGPNIRGLMENWIREREDRRREALGPR